VLTTVRGLLLYFSLFSAVDAVTRIGSGRSEGEEAGRYGGK
jgi:hypothetical protein